MTYLRPISEHFPQAVQCRSIKSTCPVLVRIPSRDRSAPLVQSRHFLCPSAPAIESMYASMSSISGVRSETRSFSIRSLALRKQAPAFRNSTVRFRTLPAGIFSNQGIDSNVNRAGEATANDPVAGGDTAATAGVRSAIAGLVKFHPPATNTPSLTHGEAR